MKVYKYSDYMRLGATYRKQLIGGLFDGHKTCARGAANEGYHLFHNTGYNLAPTSIYIALCVSFKFPALYQKSMCPVCSKFNFDKFANISLIEHINDSHHWSREAIAEWYEWQFEDGRTRIKGEILCLDQLPDFMEQYCPKQKTKKGKLVLV